jgi:hypothetical protein
MRLPERSTASKSARRVSVRARARTRCAPAGMQAFGVSGRAAFAQTASRALPFALRALITARPALVFMRTRKPCVRLRRVFDGW